MENQETRELYNEIENLISLIEQPKNDKRLLELNNIDLDFKLFPIIISIAKLQPITVRELSIFSGQPHSTTSRQLQRLKASNLIVSTVNPLDTRSRVIKLSDDGIDLLDKIKKGKLSFLDRAFSEVPKSKIKTISENLSLLTKILIAQSY
ncbi:MarR family winged helix-turn-helix transcriptional regulator [Weissella paramesenteroides]|uniref:MarR family winged helix-turn-helix transcriptional regulator n=1 Tax=Weissella paramesenteroides TaxID=1249 RepID=UPI0013D93238|nr:MarR family transcriptional regulator [Weissella paramesenteroides]NEZ89052.1 hypothetical protein [Weissella paramesenteroides]NFB03377.1 hypothetical protein [Weissella paramesenteroides]